VIADAWLQADAPPDFLVDALRRLAAETGESAYLSAWREDGIRALASVGGVRAVRVATPANGPYRSPHARATGKLLLAYADEARRASALGAGELEPVTPNTITDRARLAEHLEAIRRAGFAEDHEEFMEGVSCVAAPVLLGESLIAALTVSAPTQRFDRHRAELRNAVLRAARAATGESSTQPQEVA
jgi:DNA-binding IclR family transcriptional regulator